MGCQPNVLRRITDGFVGVTANSLAK